MLGNIGQAPKYFLNESTPTDMNIHVFFHKSSFL